MPLSPTGSLPTLATIFSFSPLSFGYQSITTSMYACLFFSHPVDRYTTIDTDTSIYLSISLSLSVSVSLCVYVCVCVCMLCLRMVHHTPYRVPIRWKYERRVQQKWKERWREYFKSMVKLRVYRKVPWNKFWANNRTMILVTGWYIGQEQLFHAKVFNQMIGHWLFVWK